MPAVTRRASQSGTPRRGTGTRGRTATPKRTHRTRTRLRIRTNDDNTDDGEVHVSSGVTISAAEGDSSEASSEEADNNQARGDHDSGSRSSNRDAGGGRRGGNQGSGRRGNEANGGGGGRRRGGSTPRRSSGNNDSGGREDDNNEQLDEDEGVQRQSRQRRVSSNQTQHDDAAAQSASHTDDMGWWDTLTPDQQRHLAKRLFNQAPAATAAAPPTVVVQTPDQSAPRRHKMKSLNLADFKGKPNESVEAWLATIPQEVERQLSLGGDTWSVSELFYGTTAHLKEDASEWLITLGESMREEDKNLAYLVKMMRKKFGRRESMFRVQQRLAARRQMPGERLADYARQLTRIGFEKKVPAEYYVDAFVNGINNENAAMIIQTCNPTTLDEAVQFACDKCGEYGEGPTVTDWRAAKRRYRDDDRGADEDAQPARKKTAAADAMDSLDWKKMGLGFGGANTSPMYDEGGRVVSGLEETAKKDPLSMAALRAMLMVAGVGRDQNKTATTKAKTARTLEVKGESLSEEEKASAPSQQRQVETQQQSNNYEESYGGNYGGNNGGGYGASNRGRGGGRSGGRGRGYGRGRGNGGGLERYGPPQQQDSQSIMERKKQSTCHYCGQQGHWLRQCAQRIEDEKPQGTVYSRQPQGNQAGAAAGGGATSTPATSAAGNGQRQ